MLINPELWVNDSRSETGCIGENLPIIRRTPQGERRRCKHGEGRLFRNAPFSGLCDGVADEAAERRTWCVADYMTAVRHPSKTLAAALFMFFATLFSTVALGSLAERRTANRMGLTEYLFMNAVAGVVHALAGAQPLLVLRPTGPITAITVKLADAADAFGFDFHQFAAATGLWVGLLMALVAATATSKHIRRLTPFTHDIFACFVCSIYLHDGVSDIVARLGTSLCPCLFMARASLGAPDFYSQPVPARARGFITARASLRTPAFIFVARAVPRFGTLRGCHHSHLAHGATGGAGRGVNACVNGWALGAHGRLEVRGAGMQGGAAVVG